MKGIRIQNERKRATGQPRTKLLSLALKHTKKRQKSGQDIEK
jgi:hypothetical protein